MKNKSVYIIGGGNSLVGFDFNKLKDKDTIAINKSLFYIPQPTYFISIDHSIFDKIPEFHNYLNRLKNTTKIFIANFACEFLKEKNGRIIDTRWKIIYDLKNFNMIIKSYQTNGIGLKWNDFRNGNNSGYCAFQLAVLLGYTDINLLGIDLIIDKKTHFHEGYSQDPNIFKQKLEEYYQNFIIGLEELKQKRPEIKIYSCSKISRLNSILEYRRL